MRQSGNGGGLEESRSASNDSSDGVSRMCSSAEFLGWFVICILEEPVGRYDIYLSWGWLPKRVLPCFIVLLQLLVKLWISAESFFNFHGVGCPIDLGVGLL